jgi:hypothetical protein
LDHELPLEDSVPDDLKMDSYVRMPGQWATKIPMFIPQFELGRMASRPNFDAADASVPREILLMIL